jgi:hypothetical protein
MDGVADAAPRFESMFYKVLKQYKQVSANPGCM